MDLTSPTFYWQLPLAIAMLVLPGMALYLLATRLFHQLRGESLVEIVSLGVGLSVAFWPLLLLYISVAGLRTTGVVSMLVLFVSAGYIAFELAANMGGRERKGLFAGIALAGMVALALMFRLGDIQGLVVPMFGDSLHHTLIAQLIAEGGRVPSSYEPYVPVETFTYHFGFHTLAALFAQMTGAGTPGAVLLVGQVLNVAALPVAYALNHRLFGSRLAGLGAALATGFISVMPAYYVNWGRYTQLAGQILLPVALVFAVRLCSKEPQRRDLALLALCVAGLVVVHYRILIFFGLFALALWIVQAGAGRGAWRDLIRGWRFSIAAILIGLAATSLWIANLITNYVPGLVGRLSTVTTDYLAEYNDPATIVRFAGRALPALALLGTVATIIWWVGERRGSNWGLWLKDVEEEEVGISPLRACGVLLLWTLFIVGSLWLVPGAIGGYTVAIILYIPLAALGGYGLAWLLDYLASRLRLPQAASAFALMLAAPLCALSTGSHSVLDTAANLYLHTGDMAAFRWVEENTPPDARFLISSQITYKGRGVTASDGGMWLPLLAGRKSSPPALSAWTERPVDRTFFSDTRLLAAYSQPVTSTVPASATGVADSSSQTALVEQGLIPDTRPLTDPIVLALLKKLGISHIYVGVQGDASKPRLDVETLRREQRLFTLLYAKDGAYVFQVNP